MKEESYKLEKHILYLNKVIVFYKDSGCIPKGSTGYCYNYSDEYIMIFFKEEILGMQNFKIHINVLKNNCRIID
tara:strand:+ start:1919 stop:2140 length:222 start_codon:yes stop_codon:yes gene_type:complete